MKSEELFESQDEATILRAIKKAARDPEVIAWQEAGANSYEQALFDTTLYLLIDVVYGPWHDPEDRIPEDIVKRLVRRYAVAQKRQGL